VVKEPLKRIFGHRLPAKTVERPKVGFPVNLERILPPTIEGATATDRWFNFCLHELGIEQETVSPACV